MGERLVVIGGDAGGMTAATHARRLDGDLDIVALEKGAWVSYSACGIPYLVAGDLERPEELVARTPQEFRDNHRIDVRLRHEAMAIDTDAGQVEVRDHEHGRTVRIPYDQLVVATGASPFRPDMPGINGETVLGVQTLDRRPAPAGPEPPRAFPGTSSSSVAATSAWRWPRPTCGWGRRSPSSTRRRRSWARSTPTWRPWCARP